MRRTPTPADCAGAGAHPRESTRSRERADGAALTETRAAPKIYLRRTVIDRRLDAKHTWLAPIESGRLLGITAAKAPPPIRRETVTPLPPANALGQSCSGDEVSAEPS